jgi:hypothetical protein
MRGAFAEGAARSCLQHNNTPDARFSEEGFERNSGNERETQGNSNAIRTVEDSLHCRLRFRG